MGEEQTIEELEAKRDALRKARLEKEIAEEEALIEAEKLKKEEDEKEALRQEGYERAIAEIKDKSKTQTEKTELNSTHANLSGFIKEFAEFGNNDLARLDMLSDTNKFSGRTYEDAVKDLAAGIKRRVVY